MNFRKSPLSEQVDELEVIELQNQNEEEMGDVAKQKTFRIENIRYPHVTSRPYANVENKIMKFWKRASLTLILFALVIMPFNMMLNEAHEKELSEVMRETEQVEAELEELTTSFEYSIFLDHMKKEEVKTGVNRYLVDKNASEDLLRIAPFVIELSYLHGIDPLRPLSIILLESKYGKSEAFIEDKNVCGMNWTEEQKRRIGIKGDIFNVATEKTLEASATNLVMLLVDYANFKTPLVTLSQIQTKYAPSDDPRNGLAGMDNTKWFKHTSHHYYQMEKYIKGEL